MKRKINWGIIGPGRIAQQFAHDMQFAIKGKCIAVASRSYERALCFANEHLIPQAYGSYAELLNNPEIDIVYIAVPHSFHYELSKLALSAGKAVLCEKPLTITTQKCDELCHLATAKQLYLMEGMWSYFLPAVLKAKAWVDRGDIGDLKHIKCDFGSVQHADVTDRWYNPDLAGGVLFDMGCYNLAMAYLFTQKAPVNTSVICRKADTGVDKELSLLLEYDDMDASLLASFECQYPNKLTIVGKKGYITVSDFWMSKRCDMFLNDGSVSTFEDDNQAMGFNHEIDAVSQDLLDGQLQSSIVPHDYSRFIMHQMQDIINQF